jgi:hypothetical protein
MLLFLLYLRHYPVDLFLAALFEVSESTARHTHRRLLNWFYDTYKGKISPLTLRERMASGVKIFDTLFTWIVDGSEQEVLHSNNWVKDIKFHSAKKKKATINIYIIIALDGRVLFISPSFPGINLDSEMFLLTAGEWHSLLDEQEHGFADLGFRKLWKQGYKVEVPLSDRTQKFSKLFSSYRIRIEQRFADIKDFDITRAPLRTPPAYEEELLTQHNKNWTAVCILVNDSL